MNTEYHTMDNQPQIKTCNCGAKQPLQPQTLLINTTKAAKSVPPVLLSLLIAFFPKCPACWAIYMSMFGSLGLTRLPYFNWLLPVLMVFLAMHLLLLYRRIKIVGYLPFSISMAGALIIMCMRIFLPVAPWLVIVGIVCIITGSLLNNLLGLNSFLMQKKIIKLPEYE